MGAELLALARKRGQRWLSKMGDVIAFIMNEHQEGHIDGIRAMAGEKSWERGEVRSSQAQGLP